MNSTEEIEKARNAKEIASHFLEYKPFQGPNPTLDLEKDWYCPFCTTTKLVHLNLSTKPDGDEIYCDQMGEEPCEYDFINPADRGKRKRYILLDGYRNPLSRKEALLLVEENLTSDAKGINQQIRKLRSMRSSTVSSLNKVRIELEGLSESGTMNKSEITMKVVGQQFKDALKRLELATGGDLEFIVALQAIDDKTLLTEKDVSPESCDKRDFLIWASLYFNLLNSASIKPNNLELIKVIVEAFKGHLNQEDMIKLNSIYNKFRKENGNTYNQMSIFFTDSSLIFYSEKDTDSVLNLIS